MRMNEFTRLSQREKVALLYREGIYIGKRRQGPTAVVLYQIEEFYAEVYYRSYRREIERIFCFSDMERLDPYLADMDVEPLVI